LWRSGSVAGSPADDKEQIQDQIADLILDGKLVEGGCVRVTLDESDKILVKVHEGTPLSSSSSP